MMLDPLHGSAHRGTLPQPRAVEPLAPQKQAGHPPTRLSVVMPYFRKLAEFTRVLPLQHAWLARPDLEVILVMDTPDEEPELLALLTQYPDVRWTVLVNDRAHPWRPPCKAINVGLRHAVGQFVLVCSPESAFVGDVPSMALEVLQAHPDKVAIGRVGFARFADLENGKTLALVFDGVLPPDLTLHTFYGSICAARSSFEAVHGYDESFAEWGGDDDNVRVRLELQGHHLLACPGLRLLHLSFEARNGTAHYDVDLDILKCAPHSAQANTVHGWGRDFTRVAWRTPSWSSALAAAPAIPSATGSTLPTALAIATRSRRRCDICGRMGYFEPPQGYCVKCGPPPGQTSATWPPGTTPRILCVMQLHNEARYLEGCLAHLRGHVDGVIALDDGSTDGTGALLTQHPLVLDHITHPVRHPHVWDELHNKRSLLERARAYGADWVLVCDADERFETAFLESLRHIARALPNGPMAAVVISLRELWNSPTQYRIDGVWGAKTQTRFFSLPPEIHFEHNQALHGLWLPDGYVEQARMVRMFHHLYHLKSIHHEDRVRRRDFYKRLDPDHRYQAIGYDYLAEEPDTLRLESIRPGRDYLLTSLPNDMV